MRGVWHFRAGRFGRILPVSSGTVHENVGDPFLLDGLVRATLNHGSLSGAAEADFSALEGQMRDRLNKLGYFQKEPLPIEWFFTSCKPCKGVTE